MRIKSAPVGCNLTAHHCSFRNKMFPMVFSSLQVYSSCLVIYDSECKLPEWSDASISFLENMNSVAVRLRDRIISSCHWAHCKSLLSNTKHHDHLFAFTFVAETTNNLLVPQRGSVLGGGMTRPSACSALLRFITAVDTNLQTSPSHHLPSTLHPPPSTSSNTIISNSPRFTTVSLSHHTPLPYLGEVSIQQGPTGYSGGSSPDSGGDIAGRSNSQSYSPSPLPNLLPTSLI